MGAQNGTARSESISVSLTKQEKALAQEVRRAYGFASDRELVVALLKRAHLNITKKG